MASNGWLPCGTSSGISTPIGKPPSTELLAPEIRHAYLAKCCKATLQFSYLLYLHDNLTTAVANAAGLGVGWVAVCADVMVSLNAIRTCPYNDHTSRGGGMPGASALQRKAAVVLQAWEWWSLKVQLPLHSNWPPRSAPCTIAKPMTSQGPPSLQFPRSPPSGFVVPMPWPST